MSHYATLGVDRTASQDEIKKAYRKLSKQYHPDINPDGDAQFKNIAEAYNILGDETKRSKYDAYSNQQEFFSKFASGGGRNNMSDMFDQVFGNAFGGQTQARGLDLRMEMHISFGEAYTGTSKTFNLNNGPITVDFKPGLLNGQKFRLAGKGQPHPYNTTLPNGDLIITIYVIADSRFILEGTNIWVEHTLPWWDIMLGTEIPIQTPEGFINIKIPKGTHPGKTLRIKDRGFPIYGTDNKGSILCRVNAMYPELNEGQLEYIKSIKQEDGNGKQ
jgi:DnaJ-class molecular chaperone